MSENVGKHHYCNHSLQAINKKKAPLHIHSGAPALKNWLQARLLSRLKSLSAHLNHNQTSSGNATKPSGLKE